MTSEVKKNSLTSDSERSITTQFTLQVTSFNSEKGDPHPAAKPDPEPQISVKELSILYDELTMKNCYFWYEELNNRHII